MITVRYFAGARAAVGGVSSEPGWNTGSMACAAHRSMTGLAMTRRSRASIVALSQPEADTRRGGLGLAAGERLQRRLGAITAI